jgi:hypothetical protein
MLGVGAAVGIAAIFWADYNKKQENAKKNAQEFLGTLDESTGGLTSQTDALIRNTLEERNQIDNLNKAGVAFDDYRDAIADTTKISEVFNEVDRFGRRMRTDRGRQAIIKDLREEGGARNELVATLIEQGQLDAGLIDSISEQSKAYQDSLEVIRKRAEAAALLAGADTNQAKAAGDAAKENAKNAEAIKETYDNTLALLNSNIAAEQAQIASQKAVQEYTKSLTDGSLSAQDRRQKELELESQFLNTAAAVAKAAEDQATFEGKTLSAKDAAIIQQAELKKLSGQLAPDSPVQAGLQQMIDKLQGVIDRRVLDIKIYLDKYQAIAAIDDVNFRIAAMKGLAYSPGSRDYSSLEGRAIGGPVNAGIPYMVGERGPELFVPSGYGKIIDNMATMSMLSGGTPVAGGGVNVTINLPPGVNGDDVIDAIRRYERRNGPIFQAA